MEGLWGSSKGYHARRVYLGCGSDGSPPLPLAAGAGSTSAGTTKEKAESPFTNREDDERPEWVPVTNLWM